MANHEPQEEEGVGLEYLDKLTFFDDTFEYNKKIYDYKNIKNVEFTAVATKHSTNFVHTGTSYDASLFLHFIDGNRLHIKQESSFLRRKEKERSEAVMRAAGIFMNVTFNWRIEAYECQMNEKGFVSFGKHQISRNGDLFKNNERRFNIIKDDIRLGLGPFHLGCDRRNPGIIDKLRSWWSGPLEVIDISTDKDCFLYILKHYLGLYWQEHPAPEKRKSAKEIFNEALLVLGAKLCKVDGHISSQEIIRFKQYFGIDESSHPGAGKIFNDAAKTSTDIRETAGRIFNLLDGRTEPLEYIVIGLMQIAAADGYIHKSEKDFIRIVAVEFGFSETVLHRLFLIFEKTREQNDNDQYAANKSMEGNLYSQHLEVLGLNANATFGEIKAAYRELARRHHPDLLRAQGVPIDDIENAQEVLKVINLSYEWLARHHQKESKTSA